MTIKSIFILGLLNVCFGITVQATPVNFVAIPYSDINSLAKQLKTSRYSPFENPTGLYFEEGETIQVTAPDLQGYQLNLLLVDFSKPAEGEKKEKTTVFTLKTGNNKFYAPHKGLVYVSYYVKDCRKAPEQKLTFHTGINNGVFNAYQHTNDEWKRMLDSAIAEVIDMQGKYVHLTFDVKTLREKGSDCGVEMIRMYDRIILWQQEMLGIDQFGYRTNNHMFARISWAGPPNANGKGVSFPRTSSIIRPEDIRNSNWVIGHEFGHVNQVRPGLKWHGTTEITNNIPKLPTVQGKKFMVVCLIGISIIVSYSKSLCYITLEHRLRLPIQIIKILLYVFVRFGNYKFIMHLQILENRISMRV